ncbi:hypothetical protein VRK_43290 [Vibrio sp. MEBiC08052]|nr:hypothetical protein VRK_43290 [Vibrio sp. MEBiC08052]
MKFILNFTILVSESSQSQPLSTLDIDTIDETKTSSGLSEKML